MDTTHVPGRSSSLSFFELLLLHLEEIAGDDISLAQILAERIPEDDFDPAAQTQDSAD